MEAGATSTTVRVKAVWLVATLLVALSVKVVLPSNVDGVPVMAPEEVLKLRPAAVKVARGVSEKLVPAELLLPRFVKAKLVLCPLVAMSAFPLG
jgi:hypothetical protein